MEASAGETAPPCRLCDERRSVPRIIGTGRTYWQCRSCALISVPPTAWVDAATEKARYEQHQNDPTDARYRQFLSRLADPVISRVRPGAIGLDFGSGPEPALGQMLTEAGLRVHLYDLFYARDPAVWNRRYDFITASEVIEHLHEPRAELDRLFSVLVPGGRLAVMTRWVGDRDTFIHSRYIRDPTHVSFYSEETCRWIADRWQATLEVPRTDVALFQTGASVPPR